MAKKPEGISLADLLIGQKNSNLKMNATVEAQLKSLLEVEKLAKQDRLLQVIQTIDSVKSVDDENKIVTELNDGLIKKTGNGLNANVQELVKIAKNTYKLSLDQNKDIVGKSAGQKEFKSFGQRVGGIKDSFKDFFTMRGFLDKTGIAKRGSGGFISEGLDANEAAKKKAEARWASGDHTARHEAGTIINGKKVGGQVMAKGDAIKEYTKQAKEEQELRRKQGDLDRKLTAYKDDGLSDAQVTQTQEYRDKMKLAPKFASLNKANREYNPLPEKQDKPQENDITFKSKKEDLSESDVHNNENQAEQINLLSKIEKNTKNSARGQSKSENGDNKGGLMSGIGGKMKGIASGLGDAAKGLLALAASVWIISKAFQNFATVKFSDFMMGISAIAALVIASKFVKSSDAGKTLLGLGAALLITSIALSNFADIKWESILKAGLVLVGLALATKAMDDVSAAGTLLAIGAALWITSEAFANFGKLDWETIGKGLVVLTALTAAVIGIGLLGPVVLAGAAALLALGVALWVASKAFANIAESLDTFAAGMERIAAISGTDLMGTAAGIAAISAAMAAFGVSSVVSGLGNLVSGLLSIGQDSPIDKLEKISKMGDGLQKAADALERIGKAMQTIAGSGAGIEVGKDSIKTAGAKKAPMTKLAGPGSENSSLTETKEGALAGVTANQIQPSATQKANNVYGASSKNAEATGKSVQIAGPSIVNAPTTVNSSNQNAIIKTPIRNQDNTLISYLKSRYSQ